MASTFGSNMLSLQTPIFTGNNYEYWSLTMKALFIGQDVWEIIQNGNVEPIDQAAYNNLTQTEKDALREHRKKDGKAMFYLHQAIHESILPIVATTITSKHAWNTLEISYQGLDKVKTSKLQILRKYFEFLSIKDTELVDSFYTRFVGLINQLKSHGENIKEQRVVEKFLEVFPQALNPWL